MTEIAGQRVPRHGVRILVIWLVLCVIAVPLIVLRARADTCRPAG